jgi:hypothetical protein
MAHAGRSNPLRRCRTYSLQESPAQGSCAHRRLTCNRGATAGPQGGKNEGSGKEQPSDSKMMRCKTQPRPSSGCAPNIPSLRPVRAGCGTGHPSRTKGSASKLRARIRSEAVSRAISRGCIRMVDHGGRSSLGGRVNHSLHEAKLGQNYPVQDARLPSCLQFLVHLRDEAFRSD